MEFKIVGMKVAEKKDAHRAYKELEEKQDAGETDYYEVIGMWKSDKGKMHAKYFGNHARLIGTVVGAVFGIIPAVVGYYIGRHEMKVGKVSSRFLEGLSEHVDNGGAAIFALVDEADVPSVVAYFEGACPGSEIEIIDPEVFEADVAVLAEGVVIEEV